MNNMLISIGELLIMEMDDIIDIRYSNDNMHIFLENGEKYTLELNKAS